MLEVQIRVWVDNALTFEEMGQMIAAILKRYNGQWSCQFNIDLGTDNTARTVGWTMNKHVLTLHIGGRLSGADL